MRLTRTKLALLTPMLAAITVVTVAATTPSAGRRRVMEEQRDAKSWVQAHASALPKRLDDVAPLPRAVRHELMARLTWSERGQLWQDHLAIFLKNDTELSPSERAIVNALGASLNEDQRAFIARARDRLAQVFAPNLTIAQRQALAKPFCDSAKVYFTKGQAPLIFGSLGIDMHRAEGLAPEQAAIGADLLIGVVRDALAKIHLARRFGDCECNQGSLCDCFLGVCTASPNCTPQIIFACGCFGIWQCNGMCG